MAEAQLPEVLYRVIPRKTRIECQEYLINLEKSHEEWEGSRIEMSANLSFVTRSCRNGNMGRQILTLEKYNIQDGIKLNEECSLGDRVTVRRDNSNVIVTVGIISQISSTILKIMLSDCIEIENGRRVTISMDSEYCSIPYDAVLRALNQLRHQKRSDVSYNLFKVLMNESRPQRKRLLQSITQENDFQLFNERLNESQREAVIHSLCRPELAVIRGPPGTGKTTVLVEIIQQSIKLGKKILVCAPSNVAVDVILKRLVDANISALRLGHSFKISEECEQYTAQYNIYHSDRYQGRLTSLQTEISSISDFKSRRNEMSRLHREDEYCTAEIISQYDVVLSTLITASNIRSLRNMKDYFSLVIIDECSQAYEAACYIPALLAPKLILVGDDKQLAPVVRSSEALWKGLDRSIMTRIRATMGGKHQDLIRMLDRQYRMNSSIMKWPSKQFYKNELVADETVARHVLADLPNVERTSTTVNPLFFANTCGRAVEKRIKRGGYCNIKEVNIVHGEIKKLIYAGVDETLIAVISPYKKQVRELQKKINNDWPDIEVKTVDCFQGSEKEAVFLSLVRSNGHGNIGFLKDIRRINVAVTRARRHLTVVGDSKTLGSNKVLNSFMNYLIKKACRISVDQYISLPR